MGMSSLTGGLVLDDCCDHPSSCLDNHQPYPVLCTLLEHVERISRDPDELDKCSLGLSSPLIWTESSGWII